LLALARGRHERTVCVDARRLCGQGTFAALPDIGPNLVDDTHQPPDRLFVEAAAEVAGRGRVGDRAGAQHVQEGGVVATDLDVVQDLPAAQDVVGDIEHVVRVLVRASSLQDAELRIDHLGQPSLPHQLVDRGEAAVWHRASALGHLVGRTWSAELRASLLPRLRAPYEGLQALDDLPLPSLELSTYLRFHLKRSPGVTWLASHPPKHREFFKNSRSYAESLARLGASKGQRTALAGSWAEDRPHVASTASEWPAAEFLDPALTMLRAMRRSTTNVRHWSHNQLHAEQAFSTATVHDQILLGRQSAYRSTVVYC